MDGIEVVVAHRDRATLRVGEVFLKVDTDRARADIEVEAMARAPIPTPEVLWREPPVLALARVPGTVLGRLGRPSEASPAAWRAAGAAVRRLHDAPLPPWPSSSHAGISARLAADCDWLITSGTLPADLVARNREIAEAALQPAPAVFVHGDLQVDHVFVEDDEVSGVIDWSEGGAGNGLFDLATLTLGHPEHLDDVLSGYRGDVDVPAVTAWWSVRGLLGIRWLIENGYDPFSPGGEVDALRSRM